MYVLAYHALKMFKSKEDFIEPKGHVWQLWVYNFKKYFQISASIENGFQNKPTYKEKACSSSANSPHR